MCAIPYYYYYTYAVFQHIFMLKWASEGLGIFLNAGHSTDVAHSTDVRGSFSCDESESVVRARPMHASTPPQGKSGHPLDSMVRDPKAEEARTAGSRVSFVLDDAPRASRPKLLYKHFPKAGGSFTKGVLTDSVLDVRLIKEGFMLTPAMQQARFVISSIREPCSYYVSLWAFGTQTPQLVQQLPHCCSFYRNMYIARRQDTCRLYAHPSLTPSSGPSSGWRNVSAFREWLRDGQISGLFGARVLSMYSSHPHVDCWVSPGGDLLDNIGECLGKFEAQGGVVSWANFSRWRNASTANASTRSTGDDTHGRRLALAGDMNSSPHLPCEAYYDEPLRRAVSEGLGQFALDASVSRAFGLGSCCAKQCNACSATKRQHARHDARHIYDGSTKP